MQISIFNNIFLQFCIFQYFFLQNSWFCSSVANRHIPLELYDYVIVGSGPGGIGTARGIIEGIERRRVNPLVDCSRDEKIRILVLERGFDAADSQTATNSAGQLKIWTHPLFVENLHTKDGIFEIVADTIGGGTSHNSGVFYKESDWYFSYLKQTYGVDIDPRNLDEGYDLYQNAAANPADLADGVFDQAQCEALSNVGFSPCISVNEAHAKLIEGTHRVYSVFNNVSGEKYNVISILPLDKIRRSHKSIDIDTEYYSLKIQPLSLVQRVEFEDANGGAKNAKCVLYGKIPTNSFNLNKTEINYLHGKAERMKLNRTRMKQWKFINSEILDNRRFSVEGYDSKTFNAMGKYSPVPAKVLLPYTSLLETIRSSTPLLKKPTFGKLNSDIYKYKLARACIKQNFVAGKIIIAAGGVHTPILLMKSGIGSAEQIAKTFQLNLGDEGEIRKFTVIENQYVGKNFHEQPAFQVGAFLKEGVELPVGFAQINKNSYKWLQSEEELIKCTAKKPCDNAVRFCSVQDAECEPVFVQTQTGRFDALNALYGSFGEGVAFGLPPVLRNHALMKPFLSMLTAFVYDGRGKNDFAFRSAIASFDKYVSFLANAPLIPYSRGSVDIDKFGEPILDLAAFSDPRDIDTASLVFAQVQKAFNDETFKQYFRPISQAPDVLFINYIVSFISEFVLPVIQDPVTVETIKSSFSSLAPSNLDKTDTATFPQLQAGNYQQIRNSIKATWTPIWHNGGSAAFNNVTNPKTLSVYGSNNLLICDISIFPTVPLVNPSATIASLCYDYGKKMYNSNFTSN